MKRIISLLLILLMLLSLCHAEENAQADLQARFGGQATLEYNGTSYAVKKRNTTMMICACQDGRLQLCYLLAVDDNALRMVPIRLSIGAAGEAFGGKSLSHVYLLNQPPEDESISQADADAMRLLSAVNQLFPEPLIESYLLINAEGLNQFDGGWEDDPALPADENLKNRIKAIGKAAMNASSSEQMDMVEKMSPYLVTDVKTGTLVKIADKAKRYEIVETQWFPGMDVLQTPAETPDGDLPVPTDTLRVTPYQLDEEALMALLLEYFYDETMW